MVVCCHSHHARSVGDWRITLLVNEISWIDKLQIQWETLPQNVRWRDWEMAQQVGALTSLTEDLGSYSTHMVAHNNL